MELDGGTSMKFSVNEGVPVDFPPLADFVFETDCGVKVKVTSRDSDGIGPWNVCIGGGQLCSQCLAEIGAAISALATYVSDTWEDYPTKVGSLVTDALIAACGPAARD